jgi:hypothetical protein
MTQHNKRDYRRRYVGKVIEFVMVPSSTDEALDGIIFDISETGLSILTTAQLTKDQKILIKGDISSPSATASVRWTKEFYHLYYKVGLQFI